MTTGTCKSCGQRVIWSPVAESGTLMPLDPQTELGPAERLVAYNPETNLCRVLKRSDVREAQRWADHGVTFHRSHMATCAQAAQWRGRAT